MRFQHRIACACFALAILFPAAGCLNLGGKTTYTTESPATSERLASLETRVSLLERASLGNAPTASVPVGTPIYEQQR